MADPISIISNSSATPAASAAATSGAKTEDSTDAQDRFLKLLIAQMKNQDPLNPLDNAQVTSQMAQISTVSGIDQLNKTLQSLRGDVGGLTGMETLGLAGHSVLVTGNVLALSGGQAAGGFELPEGADKVELAILDGAGQTVHQASLGALGAGLHTFQWDGKGDSGAAAPEGAYSMLLKAYSQNRELTVTPLSVGRVDGVNRTGGTPTLSVGVLGTKTLADVRRIM